MGLGAKIDWLSVFPEESEVQIERERAGGREGASERDSARKRESPPLTCLKLNVAHVHKP